MRRSEFQRAVEHEFGRRGDSLVADLTLTALGHRTAAEALDAGEPARDVWLALCAQTDVPHERRHGVGRLESRRN
ncbi:MAG: DUF3046 domain-containing protein [Microbacterium sp.]|uniref:DUF3046 domain-containing protein n=1 Tax=Microbacterium sp. TaxID=51671 RepID=UPI0039E6EDF2